MVIEFFKRVGSQRPIPCVKYQLEHVLPEGLGKIWIYFLEQHNIAEFTCWNSLLKYSLSASSHKLDPSFCRLKSLGVFLLTLGWDASPSQAYLQHWICWYPFTHVPGWTEALWNLSVLPKNTTQCPRPGLTMGLIDPKTSALTRRTNNRASNLWSKWTPWSSLGVHGKGS